MIREKVVNQNTVEEAQLSAILQSPEAIKEIVQGNKDLFKELLKSVKDEERRRFLHYKPYSKQKEFHDSHATERILSGANQSGKSIAGCMETCFHLTGNYPSWWKGHRVSPRINAATGEQEINAWVLGTDSKTVRDSLQSKIIGTAGRAFRDGCIHPDYIDTDSIINSRGVQGLVDTIYIKHKSGCKVKLQFRSYEQGRENLQAATIDFVYCDEEPPAELIGELRARLGATGGFMYMAFTPLKGMTPLVQEFWGHDNPEKFLVCMNIYEASHYTPEKIAKIESLYSGLSVAERKARMMGVPTMGTGLIYPIEDKEIMYEPMAIPKKWRRLAALDFGRGEHPQAMVWGALDTVNDVLYIYDAIKTVNKTVADNASIIKRHGEWIPCAYPHDLNRDSGVGDEKKTEGYKYKELYQKEGVKLTPEFAQTKDHSNKVEVGIIEMRQRMIEGRFKVASTLSEWFKEKQIYRYGDDNKPVKEKDDLMDATRYLTIMLRYAISEEENMFNSLGRFGTTEKATDNTEVY